MTLRGKEGTTIDIGYSVEVVKIKTPTETKVSIDGKVIQIQYYWENGSQNALFTRFISKDFGFDYIVPKLYKVNKELTSLVLDIENFKARCEKCSLEIINE